MSVGEGRGEGITRCKRSKRVICNVLNSCEEIVLLLKKLCGCAYAIDAYVALNLGGSMLSILIL